MPEPGTQLRNDTKPPAAVEGARDTVIEVTDFAAVYGGKTVLHDVNFRVRRGEVLVIAGDSGSGKSTLLKVPM